MYNLSMSDLTANAFIELLKAHQPARASYKQLEQYAEAVCNILFARGEGARFLLSRDETQKTLGIYAHLFSETSDGIELRPGIRLSLLIEAFRGYLPWQVIEAFSSPMATAMLIK